MEAEDEERLLRSVAIQNAGSILLARQRAGFQVHISKPVEPAELVATVANVAGRSGEPEAG